MKCSSEDMHLAASLLASDCLIYNPVGFAPKFIRLSISDSPCSINSKVFLLRVSVPPWVLAFLILLNFQNGNCSQGFIRFF